MKKQGKGILDGIKSLVSKGEELAKKYRPARAINTYLRDQGWKDPVENSGLTGRFISKGLDYLENKGYGMKAKK